MPDHYRLFSDTKQQYRELLTQGKEALTQRLLQLRGEVACPECDTAARSVAGVDSVDSATASNLTVLFQSRHAQCAYEPWRQVVLEILEQEIGRDILTRLQQINAYKNTFSCHMCGMCCRLASSEYSYTELVERAESGDDFARQFTSIFLPYASQAVARAKYPEAVDAVLAYVGKSPELAFPEEEQAGTPTAGGGQASSETVYFYHCPYIGEDNRCTVYGTEKRPDICARYPENALGFVYKQCAWKPWQDETHTDTLLAHALLNLCEDWSAKLRQK